MNEFLTWCWYRTALFFIRLLLKQHHAMHWQTVNRCKPFAPVVLHLGGSWGQSFCAFRMVQLQIPPVSLVWAIRQGRRRRRRLWQKMRRWRRRAFQISSQADQKNPGCLTEAAPCRSCRVSCDWHTSLLREEGNSDIETGKVELVSSQTCIHGSELWNMGMSGVVFPHFVPTGTILCSTFHQLETWELFV